MSDRFATVKSYPTTPAAQPPASERYPAQATERPKRQLVVGRGISLSGEIKSCDSLLVEGSLATNVAGCHEVKIAETGSLSGTVSIEEAEVSGVFDGTLTVQGRLLIRAGGKVSGTIRYGQIEIERTGTIIGDINVLGETSSLAKKAH